MNTYPLYSDITETFTVPDAPDADVTATVTYEWGNEIVAATVATNTTGNTYSIAVPDEDVNAVGMYRIKWSCDIGASAFYSYTNFRVEAPYITETSFFANYPEFDIPEYQGTAFNIAEKNARRIIDTYCGQSFDPIFNKTLTVDGNDRTVLKVLPRLAQINNVYLSDGTTDTDYSTIVEIDPETHHYIRFKPTITNTSTTLTYTKFPSSMMVKILGDWGWSYVPANIEQATELLVMDMLDETRRETFKYGLQRLWQDTQRFEFDPSIYNTTGNLDVDVLLMDYVFWTMDYVS